MAEAKRILHGLTAAEIAQVMCEVISVEVDREAGIDLGFKQEAWHDVGWTAYPYTVKYDWADINPYSFSDSKDYPAVKTEVIREKLKAEFYRKGTHGYGVLRYDAGANVTDIITKTGRKGLVIVEDRTGLVD